MTGETVTVEERREIGRDDHNDPVWAVELREVANVLVQPGAGSDISDGNRDGRSVSYTLMWPKADGSPILDGLRVRVRGEWCRVIGAPRAYDAALCPTDWNMSVPVECAHG